MGIAQVKYLRVLFNHRRSILRSREDSTVVSVVMYSAFAHSTVMGDVTL